MTRTDSFRNSVRRDGELSSSTISRLSGAPFKYHHHLFQERIQILISVLSESIPALGWVTVSPAPAPFVLEMFNAGQFYTNRFLSIRSNENVQLLDQVDDVLRQGAEGLQGQGRHPCGVGEGMGPMSCRASGSTKWCIMMMTMMVNVVMLLMIS